MPPAIFESWDGMGLVTERIEHVPNSGMLYSDRSTRSTPGTNASRRSALSAAPSGSRGGREM